MSSAPLLAETPKLSNLKSAEQFILDIPGRKQISPMQMPTKALQEDLSDTKWLRTIRDILTRQGSWKKLPTNSVELIVVSPAPGVVGVDDINWQSSLGFGDITIKGQHTSCSNNVCPSQISTSGVDNCSGKVCSGQSCENYDCSGHACSGGFGCSGVHNCTGQSTMDNMISEIESQWNSEFVQYMVEYFNIDTTEDLVKAVMNYTTRNMYDKSALMR